MSSPIHSIAPSRDEILAASQRRAQTSMSPDMADELRFDRERDLRQSFRRLLDPGILRGVEKKTALTSMETLLTIADNLLSHPDNDKFKQFKPTNPVIKRTLVDVKGALEYAVEVNLSSRLAAYIVLMLSEMGFRANVKNFQPSYVFNPRKTTELRIGASILREALERVSEKEERTIRSKQQEKAAVDLQARQVKLAFEDDRKRKALQDKLERERREAREVTTAAKAASPLPDSDSSAAIPMRGGRTLSSPPPYQDVESDAD